MRRPACRLCFVAIMTLALLGVAIPALVASPPTPIGCGADGFCNTLCALDPDCTTTGCVHNKPCTTNADCQPLGFCAVYRLCVCTG